MFDGSEVVRGHQGSPGSQYKDWKLLADFVDFEKKKSIEPYSPVSLIYGSIAV